MFDKEDVESTIRTRDAVPQAEVCVCVCVRGALQKHFELHAHP